MQNDRPESQNQCLIDKNSSSILSKIKTVNGLPAGEHNYTMVRIILEVVFSQ